MNQAMLRFVSVRIPELIHNSLAVWMTSDGDLAIWRRACQRQPTDRGRRTGVSIINTAGKRIDLLTCQGLDTPVRHRRLSGGAKSAILASSSKVLVPLVKDSSQMEFSEQGRGMSSCGLVCHGKRPAGLSDLCPRACGYQRLDGLAVGAGGLYEKQTKQRHRGCAGDGAVCRYGDIGHLAGVLAERI